MNRRSFRLALAAIFLCGVAVLVAWMFSNPKRAAKPSKTSSPGASGSASALARAAMPRALSPAAPQQLVKRIFPYGSGPGQLGMSRPEGSTPAGPESFTLAPDGRILIADLVNHRVLICQADGTVAQTIDFPGIRLNDVIADDRGNIIVYDQRTQTLHHADTSGRIISSLALPPESVDTRGYFHLAQGSVFFADAALRDVLVADFRDAILSKPQPGAERIAEGIHAESGRVFSVLAARGESLRLAARDSRSGETSFERTLPLPDILSARYSGEDRQGRCYVALERLVAGRVVLEVRTFDPAGEQLSALQLPQNDYFIWTSRLVEASRDGIIVQFLPSESQASLGLLRP